MSQAIPFHKIQFLVLCTAAAKLTGLVVILDPVWEKRDKKINESCTVVVSTTRMNGCD